MFSIQLTVLDTATNTLAAPIQLFLQRMRGGFSWMALSLDGATGYIANPTNRALGIVELPSGQGNILMPTVSPSDVAIAPDGRTVYLAGCKPICTPGFVQLLDTATQLFTQEIEIDGNPYRIRVAPNGARAYTANLTGPSVSVLDLAANRAVATVSVPVQPTGLAVSADSATIWVASQTGGTLTAIDAASNQVRAQHADRASARRGGDPRRSTGLRVLGACRCGVRRRRRPRRELRVHGIGTTRRMRTPTAHFDRFWATDWALTILLIFLATTIFVLRPLETLGYNVRLLATVVFSFILISGIVAVSHSRRLAMVFGALAVVSVIVRWTRYTVYGPEGIAFESVAAIASLGMLAGIVLTQVFREGPVTFQRIQGAVAAYLLIALMFAAAYTWVALAVPDAFSGPPPTPDEQHDAVQRFLYFSFVTLTTVGYGDITPQAPLARSLAMLEALIGQMFPSILLARLVSLELWYRQRRFEREQAALDREALAREVARQLKGDQ